MTARILITGANGGFGRLTTNALLDAGHRVAAAMRHTTTKNVEAAHDLGARGAHVVDLDVTDDDSVERGVAESIDAMGGLDVVVNNAGIGVNGFQESFTIDDWHKVFDVNVYGVQRVNRAALPTLRQQRSGLLVHVSSLVGRLSLPFFGPYGPSKYAVEGMAEIYRAELSGFGVESIVVEPGAYPTSFVSALAAPSDPERSSTYGVFAEMPTQMLASFEESMAQTPKQDPQHVADAITALVEMPAGQRPFRTIVDSMGLGQPVGPYNDLAEQMTRGVYESFGMGGLLTVQTTS
jgi:NAD(P)-dependent dehydrogenase (short-subunit alcohol dehydrogenase family)